MLRGEAGRKRELSRLMRSSPARTATKVSRGMTSAQRTHFATFIPSSPPPFLSTDTKDIQTNHGVQETKALALMFVSTCKLRCFHTSCRPILSIPLIQRCILLHTFRLWTSSNRARRSFLLTLLQSSRIGTVGIIVQHKDYHIECEHWAFNLANNVTTQYGR